MRDGWLCRATADERAARRPGDIESRRLLRLDHGLTLSAPAARVWPWLAQMGAGRGGWYTYDWIDNGGRPSARTVRDELQAVGVGDVMPGMPGKTSFFVVVHCEPARCLTIGVPGSRTLGLTVGTEAWCTSFDVANQTFWLEPCEEARTARLHVRLEVGQGIAGRSLAAPALRLLLRVTLPFGHFVMQRKQLVELRRRTRP